MAEALGLGEIVGIQKDSGTLALNERLQVITQGGGGDGSSPAVGSSRKIRSAVEQDAGNGELLLHATAPGADALGAAVVEIEVGEKFFDARLAFGGRDTRDRPSNSRLSSAVRRS